MSEETKPEAAAPKFTPFVAGSKEAVGKLLSAEAPMLSRRQQAQHDLLAAAVIVGRSQEPKQSHVAQLIYASLRHAWVCLTDVYEQAEGAKKFSLARRLEEGVVILAGIWRGQRELVDTLKAKEQAAGAEAEPKVEIVKQASDVEAPAVVAPTGEA